MAWRFDLSRMKVAYAGYKIGTAHVDFTDVDW